MNIKMNLISVITKLLPLVLISMLFIQCTEDNDDLSAKTEGQLSIEMTDAPTDDPNVQGVFVTVAEVKIDGETYSGFSGKKTIDIMAYQNGKTEALGLGNLEAKSYSNITLVLDYETDAQGNQPGCYVLTTENRKKELNNSSASQAEITLSKAFTVEENEETNLVIDFDLRKAITYEENNSDSEQNYDFVTMTELESALRVVNKSETSTISGDSQNNLEADATVIVYAYPKGTYSSSETQAQGSSDITFKNATTSAMVQADGSFQLSFVEEGDYELIFCSYEDTDNDGKLEAQGIIELGVGLGLTSELISVDANATATVSVILSGLCLGC